MSVIKKLRKLFKFYKLDGYIVPKNDEFFGEYIDDRDDRLNFISLFSGSAGHGLILKKKAYLFVDGRYTLQAKKESNKNFKIVEIQKTKPSKILAKINQKLKIGFDPKLFSEASLINNFQTKNTTLIPIEKNLIDKIWLDRSKVKINKFFILNSKHAGKDYKSKVNMICKILKKRKINKLFITAPENLAWILNIRGKDSKYSPLPNCHAIVDNNKKITLIVNKNKINKKFRSHFKNILNYISPSNIIKYFNSLSNSEVFLIDKFSCSFFYKKEIEKRLRLDVDKKIKAVCIVHNETSTGCASDVEAVREILNNLNHDALLMVDTISGLASINYEHDEWGVDITISGSQKGLMLPPGLSFNAISEKAIDRSKNSNLRKSYWDWVEHLEFNKTGFFPYTPATNLLFGLKESIDMLHEEGLNNVFNRHSRYSKATRIAVNAWGLEVYCQNEERFSDVLTAVLVPENKDADQLRKIILENFNMSLGNGLSKLKGKVFRIGHLGDFNDISLLGILSGIEMGLDLMQIPIREAGVEKAREYLKENL
mgnify:CR=1 FL=1